VVQIEPPDVILLDLGLPSMSGWEGAKGVTEQPAAKRPLLVAVTGHGQVRQNANSDPNEIA